MKKLVGILLVLTAMFDSTFAQLQWTVPITVTDGANTKILGAGIHPSGTDGFDLGLDTLAPPAPPPGAFDARLRVASPPNDFFVDIRANTLAQKTYTMIYAPATGFGPIIIRWNRTTLASRGSFAIVDNITGSLYTLNMLTADSLNTSSSPFITSSVRILVTPINPLPPSIPTLVSPPDGSTNQPVLLTLRWNSATGAATYRLQVATDPSFSTLVVNDSTITDTSRAVSGLANGTLRYWRVNAKNQFGASNYSTVRNFTTIVAAPSVPTLVSPANGATNQPTTLTVVWNRSIGATNYQLQVATDLLFTTLVVNDSTLIDTSRVVSGLANGTLNYWRVNARNIGGASTYSTVRNFTTIVAVPSAPTLVSPANGATNQPTTLTVVWNRSSGATNYRLQVATDLSFTTLVVNDSTLVDTSRVVSGLGNGTLHYWRVNAGNIGGTSTYSAVRNFTTIVAAPTAPILVSPPNGSTGQSTSPTLRWNQSLGATAYRLQVARDSLFATLVVNDSTLVDTARVVTSLLNNMKYFWRVNARNVGGTSTYSFIWVFTTSLVGVKTLPGLPTEFAVSQNYPNPFNPTTNIRFELPYSDYVSLKVYDELGREVATLAEGIVEAGRHQRSFDASGLASGVYYYRLQAGGIVQTRRLIVLK